MVCAVQLQFLHVFISSPLCASRSTAASSAAWFFLRPLYWCIRSFFIKVINFPSWLMSHSSAATLSLSSRYVLLTRMNKRVSHTVYTLKNLSSFEDFQDSPSRPPPRFVRSQRHTQVSGNVFLMMLASGCSTQKRLPWYPPLAVLRIVPGKL